MLLNKFDFLTPIAFETYTCSITKNGIINCEPSELFNIDAHNHRSALGGCFADSGFRTMVRDSGLRACHCYFSHRFIYGYFRRTSCPSRNQVSNMGALLDPIADKLLVSAALIVLVEKHLAPAWAVVIILGQRIYRYGIALDCGDRRHCYFGAKSRKNKNVGAMRGNCRFACCGRNGQSAGFKFRLGFTFIPFLGSCRSSNGV